MAADFQDTLFTLLAESKSDKAVEAIVAALQEGDDATRLRAVKTLLEINDSGSLHAIVGNYNALPPEGRRIVDDFAEVLHPVARRMLAIAPKPARLNAIRYLEQSGTAETAATLAPLAGSQDKEIRDAVLSTLSRMTAPPPASTAEAAGDERQALLSALSESLESFTVHRDTALIETAFAHGAAAYSMLRDHVLGQHALSKAIMDASVRDISPAKAGFIVDLYIQPDERAGTQARLLLSRVDPRRFTQAFETHLMTLSDADIDRLGSRGGDLAWWIPVGQHVADTGEAFQRRVLRIAAAAPEPRERLKLCADLLASRFPDVQRAAIDQLADMPLAQARWKLTLLFRQPNTDMLLYALDKLERTPDAETLRMVAPLVNADDARVRGKAIEIVSRVSLRHYLNSFTRMESQLRDEAADALRKLNPDLIDSLCDSMEALEPAQRLNAVQIILRIGRREKVQESLLRLIRDPDSRVRASVIKAMGLFGTAEAVRVILDALKDPDRRVVANAIEAFEQLQHPRVRELIRPMMAHPDNRVRGNAVKAMLLMGEGAARTALMAMVYHSATLMRLTAVWVLRESNLPDGPALLQGIAERDVADDVRAKAKAALDYIRNKQERP